jgi:uncharacterized membrane protein
MYDNTLLTILACNLIFILVAIPLILRKVPRNPVYGFRTRKTLSDDYNWYESNAYFGRWFVVSSIISGLALFVLYSYQGLVPPEYFVEVSLACLIVPPLIAVIRTLLYARSLQGEK